MSTLADRVPRGSSGFLHHKFAKERVHRVREVIKVAESLGNEPLMSKKP